MAGNGLTVLWNEMRRVKTRHVVLVMGSTFVPAVMIMWFVPEAFPFLVAGLMVWFLVTWNRSHQIAHARGWFEGRGVMLSSLHEAQNREMTISDWLEAEWDRDQRFFVENVLSAWDRRKVIKSPDAKGRVYLGSCSRCKEKAFTALTRGDTTTLLRHPRRGLQEGERMKTKVIEVTNGPNWGKFLLGRMDEEWRLQSQIGPEPTPLLRQCGWGPEHLWVLDLQTGEGAFFKPGGYAKADLAKHRVWVCPMFEPFLNWVYCQDLTDLDALPSIVEFSQKEAPFSFAGYRRPGPDEDERRDQVPRMAEGEPSDRQESEYCAICTGTPYQSIGYDHDLRTLVLRNGYAMDEGSDRIGRVPIGVERDGFFFIATCKDCRGDFIEMLWDWADGGLLRSNVNPEANIPVRRAGRTVMVTHEEWEMSRVQGGR